jgi:predicted molibdopterin-dependent oxidoreductase YjgC
MLARVEYAPSPERDVAGYPYELGTGRVLQQYNVGTMTRRTPNAELAPFDELEIHPEDAAREQIGDGDEVALASRSATARARARLSARVRPGTLFLSFHHPETHTNRVTGPWHDPLSHCPEYKLTAVRFL